MKGELRARLPVAVYEEQFEYMPWVPSGWMGGIEHLSVDGNHNDRPHSGENCIKIRYEGTFGWAGVAWQDPPNNWGDMDGGHNLSGAGFLELWARGAYGGEKVKFGVGLLQSDRDYPDSGMASIDNVVLTSEWQRFRIPLESVDLTSIKTGFYVVLTGRSSAVTIYLDDIRFVR